MQKIIIESTATVKGSKITGTALTPTTSKNGNNYLPDVIDESKNTNIWLDNFNWEHTKEKLGPVRFTVDPETHTMFYEAINTSNRQIKEGTHKVSIEAHVDEVARTCSPKQCYNTPMSLTMEGLAVTENPSVQTTTLRITEAEQLNDLIAKSVKEEVIIKHEEEKPVEPEIKESEEIKKLEAKITELESRLNGALTCRKCGGLKKN